MQQKIILAESGGTKTDWAVCIDHQCVLQFETTSFHPQLINEAAIRQFTEQMTAYQLNEFKLLIYAAGCYRLEGQNCLFEKIQHLPFKEIQIKSDLHAAVEATGEENGWVAILGTGSALIQFNGADLNLFGGQGWENGDEGSGFYFGKLVVEELLAGKEIKGLTNEQSHFLKQLYGQPESKQRFSELAKLLAQEDSFVFHQKNITSFIDKELKKEAVHCLSFVGGYAFHQQEIVKEICQAKNIQVKQIIERPIKRLLKSLLITE